jgi:hypothetical protein
MGAGTGLYFSIPSDNLGISPKVKYRKRPPWRRWPTAIIPDKLTVFDKS